LLLAGALFATFVILDLGLRAADHRLSGNLAHIGEIPSLVDELGGKGAADATLLLGNSLTNNGVDAAALPQPVGKVTPDGSSLWDWKCIVEKQLLDHPERKVSRVVLGTAWHLASDQTRADPSRLGALFCSLGDIAHPATVGISSPGDIGEFIAARGSRVYALRDTLRNRALDKFIPHYKRFASEQNAAGRTDEQGGATTTRHDVPYGNLATLARSLKARGTSLVVVLMPVKQPYEADPALLALAASGDLRLIDYRQLPGIEPGQFIDEMHLGPDGRAVLTAQLARDLNADTPR
jgi:hypothetical protein